jgi:hypothetical protein
VLRLIIRCPQLINPIDAGTSKARTAVAGELPLARGASTSDFGGRAEAHAAIPVGVDRLPHRHR